MKVSQEESLTQIWKINVEHILETESIEETSSRFYRAASSMTEVRKQFEYSIVSGAIAR
jgi:hypothetical protein